MTADTAENTAVTDEASAKHRQELEQEKEKITSYYREQGEKALADAREKAQKILSETEQQAQDYAAQAKAQAEAIFEKSRSDGFAKGHEDGYAAGLDKCRDMLSEIKRLSEQMVSDRAELFDSYEVEIFDTVMEIVNRITLNSLGQKDKAVVKKTIKEAGKSFRGSEYVKLTLSKTDVSEEMAADTDYFKKLFTNVKNVEVGGTYTGASSCNLTVSTCGTGRFDIMNFTISNATIAIHGSMAIAITPNGDIAKPITAPQKSLQ